MSFSQALSGLRAANNNLSVVGNNIANSQTVGFKSSTTLFADVYTTASEIGLGVSVPDVRQNFTNGTVEATGRALDLAIVGEGFFKMQQGTGQIVYSRNGQLVLNPEGYLENAQGARMMDGEKLIQVNTDAMDAQPTTRMNSVYNLQASTSIIAAATPFDPTDPATYSYSSTATTFDSLGVAHQLNKYFRKTDIGTWEVYGTLDGRVIGQPGAAGGDPAIPDVLATLTFDENGLLTTVADGTAALGNTDVPPTIKLSIPAQTTPLADGEPAAIDNGAAELKFDLVITGTTQFGNNFDQSSLSQNGYSGGSLVGLNIDKNGRVYGNYSNEQRQEIGSLTLATFLSPEGLQPVGENVWVQTTASGQPLFGTPGLGRFGAIEAGAVENSNVDLTKELVDLIIAQRYFQANTQSVRSQSEVLELTVNLR